MQSHADIAELPARERILETAMRLFYAEGVRSTGIDRIIAESGVAKMSFYRHFPSKADLVFAFLDERHTRWMAWFDARLAALAARSAPAAKSAAAKSAAPKLPLVADVLGEWFADPGFRGCAFINITTEVAEATARERDIAQRHKQDLERRLVALAKADGVRQPVRVGREALMIVEGAIVRAQMQGPASVAKDARRLLQLLTD